MTDRLNGVWVTFTKDIRTDDAVPIIAAIKQLRGVCKVTPNVADFDSQVAEDRAQVALGEKLLDVLYPKREAK